jgi:Uma2 family endonuclease
MDDYALFGVRWYWIVDPELRTFEIYELRDGIYARIVGADGGRVERVPGCEGLTVDLDALWAEVDRLAAEEP